MSQRGPACRVASVEDRMMMMLPLHVLASLFSSILVLVSLAPPLLSPLVSAAIPQTLHHTNLLRTIDLTKPYVRDSTALILENISNATQTEYYWGMPLHLVPKLSYLEIKEKKAGNSELFHVERALQDHSSLQIYKVDIPALGPGDRLAVTISTAYVDSLTPYPAVVGQADEQLLLYTTYKYVPTLYKTLKQKTKIKLNGMAKSYTEGTTNADGQPDPQKSGAVLTYGPYDEPPSFTNSEKIEVHFEFTAPITYVDHLERDIEVSHWGANVAIEERYKLTNHAAKLKEQFSRIQHARQSYAQPPTHAITKLAIPLKNGARNAYYTDIIGNVSTSRFRPARGGADAHLEIQPRYPIFGGWNYTFRLGWNVDLAKVERKIDSERILKIPFLEGPENIQYESLDLTVILPEGSRNVRVYTPQPALAEERYLHKSFLDSLGRTAVKLHFENVLDEKRGKEVVVIYEYPRFAGLRKVIVVSAAVLALFVARILGGWVFEGEINSMALTT